jgi:hypothetical protein
MRRTLAVATLLALAVGARSAPPALPDWAVECADVLRPATAGNVLGVVEQCYADLVQLARAAEVKAQQAAGTGPGAVSNEQRDLAAMWLARAGDALALAGGVADAQGLEGSTSGYFASRRIAEAQIEDIDWTARLRGERRIERARLLRSLERVDGLKDRALLELQGTMTTGGEDGQVYRVPDAPQPYATTAYANEGRADQELVRRRGATYDKSGGLRPRHRSPDKTPPPPQKAPPRNHVLAFQAPAGATSAFGFFTLNRELRGPFRYRFTAGNFEKAPKDDVYLDSTSFVGVEVDVIGSSPLEFFSIGTRYVVTAGPTRGVQVFANSRGGSHGSHFLPDVQAVDVRVDFVGGTFLASVKPHGAPDDQYFEFAMHDRRVADEVWVGGIGGAQFSGKRVLGVDDLFLEPLEQP